MLAMAWRILFFVCAYAIKWILRINKQTKDLFETKNMKRTNQLILSADNEWITSVRNGEISLFVVIFFSAVLSTVRHVANELSLVR